MIECRKYARSLMFLILTLVILISPQVHSAFINQTFARSLYPSGSYIITTMPTASFPNDYTYCYIGENQLEVTLVYHDFDMDTTIIDSVDEELEKADIHISWNHVIWHHNDEDVYFDFEYEILLNEYKNEYGSNYVISLTEMTPPADGEYYNLGGYARLQNHCAVVFVETLSYADDYISAITLHELCHLLGYGHSDDSTDVMYAQYSGGNNELTAETAQSLYDLHH